MCVRACFVFSVHWLASKANLPDAAGDFSSRGICLDGGHTRKPTHNTHLRSLLCNMCTTAACASRRTESPGKVPNLIYLLVCLVFGRTHMCPCVEDK